MASSRTFTLLCGLLAAALVRATLSPPAVLTLGPEVISESKSWPPNPRHHKGKGAGRAALQRREGAPLTGGVQGMAGTPGVGEIQVGDS